MKTGFLPYFIIATLAVVIIAMAIVYKLFSDNKKLNVPQINNGNNWQPPDTNDLPKTEAANLIRYGRALITNTAAYLGPKGSVAHISNGMNCQNCHLEAGTRLYGSNFALVASSYPKYRDRSGRIESIEFRINECMERSMNGKKLDSFSRELQAMTAYLKWVGKDIKKGSALAGTGIQELSWLKRSAIAENGQIIYTLKCKVCHGANGEGMPAPDSIGYSYPPLWGEHSYNVSAGLYRISKFAAFVKNNMPFKPTASSPQLSDEEAWDVAAFVNSMQRPEKFFDYDWPDINTKPVDYPFGPYSDTFTAMQHKFGPFDQIKRAKEKAKKKPLQKPAT